MKADCTIPTSEKVPTVYTNVEYFLEWILDNINQEFERVNFG